MGGPHRPRKLLRLHVLQEVARRAGLDGRQESVVLGEARQDDHARVRQLLPKLAHRSHAVQHRHDKVHQDHIRREPLGLGDRLPAVLGLPHHLDPVLQLEERAQPLAHHGVVVHEHHTDRFSHSRPPSA